MVGLDEAAVLPLFNFDCKTKQTPNPSCEVGRQSINHPDLSALEQSNVPLIMLCSKRRSSRRRRKRRRGELVIAKKKKRSWPRL